MLLALSLLGLGAFFLGRQTAPAYRRQLVGSLTPRLDVALGPCTKPKHDPALGSVDYAARMSATIAWQSGWKQDEWPFTYGAFDSNVTIGVAWNRSIWTSVGMSVAANGHGWSFPKTFTPSGRAAHRWAVDEELRSGLLGENTTVPDAFDEQLGPSAGIWVLEDFYDEAPRGMWKATFVADQFPMKPSTVTFAMFDVDGSLIERSVELSCNT